MRVVVIGNPGGRRVELFQAALAGRGLAPAEVVAWADVLAGRADLRRVVRRGDVVRLESPGRDFEVERGLLAVGAEAEADDDPHFARASRREVAALAFDKGRILWPRQAYLGFCAALDRVSEQLEACPPHRRMNEPADVKVMFDKAACHRALLRAGMPVPRALPPVRSYNELVARMLEARCPRVFVKPCHGSSASGVVAYQTSGRLHQATTTVETVRERGELRLYNSRRVRTLRDVREIAELIDALCRHNVHVEQWLPKAGIDGRVLDLRVVVIGGEPRHVVVRTSRTPMTNLHLLNQRGEVGAVRERMGRTAWDEAMHACGQVMRECFPPSLYAGLDLLIDAGYRKHAVLEVNAFGDLLPGVLCDGKDTYTAEIEAAAVEDKELEIGNRRLDIAN